MDPKKKFVMGNYIRQDQWENKEQDRRVLSGVTHRRRQKNGGVF
jgi:hypothetical protein